MGTVPALSIRGDAMTTKLTNQRSFGARGAGCVVALAAALACAACVTPAEFRKVQKRVTDLERAGGSSADGERTRVADLGTQLDDMRRSIQELQGRLDVAEHRAQEALDEAHAARSAAAGSGGAAPAGAAAGAAAGAGVAATTPTELSQEAKDYRDAYAEWRAENAQGCIDRFTKFLQTYPASEHADDATYWLADCYFKQGNFSAAVLRFDDVARQYPKGNKAADALYRQGEALLRMGHAKAAGNAFEKVLRDYPDSARAPEAKRQLDLLKTG
jgi:tol-pal system protein YbgF